MSVGVRRGSELQIIKFTSYFWMYFLFFCCYEGQCTHSCDTHQLIATHLFCPPEPASFCIFLIIFSFLSVLQPYLCLFSSLSLFLNPTSLYFPIPLLSNPFSLYSLPRLELSHVRVNITVQYILHAFLLVLQSSSLPIQIHCPAPHPGFCTCPQVHHHGAEWCRLPVTLQFFSHVFQYIFHSVYFQQIHVRIVFKKIWQTNSIVQVSPFHTLFYAKQLTVNSDTGH